MRSFSLTSSPPPSNPPLRLLHLARFARRLARARRRRRLIDDAAADLRVLLQEAVQPLADDGVDGALDVRVSQLALRLAFELRILQLDRDHRRQPLADVF